MNKKIKLCSLFSGCGGFDYGFYLSNFDIIFAIDSYKWACNTYKSNLRLDIIHRRIQDINYGDIPDCDLMVPGDFIEIIETEITGQNTNLTEQPHSIIVTSTDVIPQDVLTNVSVCSKSVFSLFGDEWMNESMIYIIPNV